MAAALIRRGRIEGGARAETAASALGVEQAGLSKQARLASGHNEHPALILRAHQQIGAQVADRERALGREREVVASSVTFSAIVITPA